MTDRDPALQAALDRLNAERYGPSLWWRSGRNKAEEDNDLTCARRRKALAEDFDSIKKGA
jgi:hypothetical protein